MELQLGLGLPSNGGSYGLDLNSQFHDNVDARGNGEGQRRRNRGERRQGRGRAAENECGGDGEWGRSLRSNYVKVTMEGMGIGRKVDLSVHHSYDSLIETLIDMFGLRYMCDMSESCFRLVYQDNEGDWLCAEDEPWESFVQSALRIKMIKMDRWD